MKLTKSTALVFVSLLAVALLGVAIWPLPSENPDREQSEASQEAEAERPNAKLEGSEPETQVVPAEVESKPRVSIEQDSESTTELPAIRELVVQGLIIVDEPDGRETVHSSGRVTLGMIVRGSIFELPYSLKDGQWEARFSKEGDEEIEVVGVNLYGGFPFSMDELSDSELCITKVEVFDKGIPVVLSASKQRFKFGDSEVVVRVKRASPVRMLVKDADTGAHLDNVKIVEVVGHGRSDTHPGDQETKTIAANASSPFDLEPGVGYRSYNIWSPGYAWTKATILLERGGEHVVALRRSGSLSVHLEGERCPEDSQLRLFYIDAAEIQSGRTAAELSALVISPHARAAAHEKFHFTFGDLVPGTYAIRVETGDWFQSAVVLAKGLVEIVAGEQSELSLVIEKTPELVKADISGTITLSAEWELDSFKLEIELVDSEYATPDTKWVELNASDRIDGSDDTYEFALTELLAGKYRLCVSKLAFATVFELDGLGRSNLHIEIPPPVEISVQLRDAVTAQVADIDAGFWVCVIPDENLLGSMTKVTRNPVDDRFRFRVPRAQLRFMPNAEFYAYDSFLIRADRERQFTVEVQPTGKALVALMDGESQVLWPSSHELEVAAHDGEGEICVWAYQDSCPLFTLTEPGHYSLTIPTIPGYEPHAAVEFEIVAHETTELTVQLTRKP